MNLIREAESMIRAGSTLVCWFGERVTVGPSTDGGFAVTSYASGIPVQRKDFDTPKQAIRFFREAVRRDGLIQSVSAQRYAFLFPAGSSLEWASLEAPRATVARKSA